MFEIKPVSLSFSPFGDKDIEFSPLSVALILLLVATALQTSRNKR